MVETSVFVGSGRAVAGVGAASSTASPPGGKPHRDACVMVCQGETFLGTTGMCYVQRRPRSLVIHRSLPWAHTCCQKLAKLENAILLRAEKLSEFKFKLLW